MNASDSLEGLGVGDRVMIDSFEGFGGPAVIVEERDHHFCRFKVRMENGSQPPFWTHDVEVSRIEPPKEGYDSRPDTRKHIRQVQSLIFNVVDDLMRRARDHDASKLNSPEVEAFDEFTPKLKATTYGSDEYKAFLAAMKPALDHHYAHNSHHPEFFKGSVCAQCGNAEDEPCTCGGPRTSVAGIRGMSLLDLTEMLCDWKAATMRHADGDLRRSIEINQKRFGYGDELKMILVNTAERLGLFKEPAKERA